jgi:L-lactate dehydrogenase complex protein LldE
MSVDVVRLFATCLIDTVFPDIGDAVVRVLERCNVQVDFPPDQTCCGLPLYNNGFVDEARAAARHNVKAMTADGRKGPVIVPSGSCAWLMRKIYPTLLSGEDLAFCDDVQEFTEFVASRQLTPAQLPATCTAAYHPSCHLLRGMHLSDPPKTLLASVGGLTLVPLTMDDECCGFGGTFAVRHENISASMLKDKLESVAKSGAEQLIVTDAGCLLQLGGGAQRVGCPFRVRHLAEVLADANPTVK